MAVLLGLLNFSSLHHATLKLFIYPHLFYRHQASDAVPNELENAFRSISPPGVPPLVTAQQTEFLRALQSSIQFFTNRMLSDSQRGRSIANDTTVQALFTTLHEMHPQLLQYMHQLEQRRVVMLSKI
ncbi:unnamed protein product [Protopolystoma xenopodis]|uniref:Hepatocyte growth factor-regulated tyrosine kinase substrate helical domain-containing protein n=1 Tax=Protopolystoma xenopodis TaxID=117903 RepID=A0A3S5C5J4_9PLAT|nr:unnamed protein product [Protopolystoma xenopodis]